MFYSAGKETNVVGPAALSMECARILAPGQIEQEKMFTKGKAIQ